MPLLIHRHAEVERLVATLAALVPAIAPSDPFVPLPIVVGSKHVERWLRQELATALGVAGNLAFPGPRAALRGAVRALLEPGGEASPRFWEEPRGRATGWDPGSLPYVVVELLRARREDEAFQPVRRSVGTRGAVVTPRELGFASEVAHALEKLVADRPHDALAWIAAPARAPEDHRWLAELLHALHADRAEPSPAQRLAALASRAPRGSTRALVVFGLSSPSPHDRHHLAVLAAHMPVHLFLLAPTSTWVGDDPTREELLREAKRAREAEARESALAALDRANPILAASGLVARDTQAWIEECAPIEASVEDARTSSARRTLLGELQRFVDEARALPVPASEAWADRLGDGSLEVHACHGALRQCEALRDALLTRFARDPSLEPRHVLVMTPDVATFGPLVQAVLGRPVGAGGGALRSGLPVHVSDLGLRLENPVAEALLACLRLAGERVSATRIFEILGLAPVRRAFGITEEEEPRARELLQEANLRWGWSAEDRARHGQPSSHGHTVAFALERLALGALFDATEGAEAPLFDADTAAPAAPAPLRTPEDFSLFGKIARLLRELEDLSGALAAPRGVGTWAAALRDALDRFTAVNDDELAWRARVDASIEDLLPAETCDGLALERASVLAILEAALDLPSPSGGVHGGAVTVCALEPMRAIPFRIVAALGLSEGAFPRSGSLPAWDPFARRKAGEPTRTALDRHLFLEAIASARDALLLFGDGFEPKRGARKPLSSVCHEVLAAVAAHVDREAGSLVHEHPLQPWSGTQPGAHFEGVWSAASEALSRARGEGRYVAAGLQSTGSSAVFPPAPPLDGALTAATLARLLESAPRALAKARLGVDLHDRADTTEDREPLEREDLESWELYDTLLDSLPADALDDPSLDDAKRFLVARALPRARAEGSLSPGERGRFDLERLFADVDRTLERAREAADGQRIERGQAFSCVASGVTIHGSAPFAYGPADRRTLVWLSPSAPTPTRRLEAWIVLLVARASGAPVDRARIAASRSPAVLVAPNPEAARAALEALVAAYARSVAGPVLRVPNLSFGVAKAAVEVQRGETEEGDAPRAEAERALVEEELASWSGAGQRKGALSDRATRELFGHLTEAELLARAAEIVHEAAAVWAPLFAATEKRGGKSAKGAP
jgi:exodeoxyribonuclease V gamma subunit